MKCQIFVDILLLIGIVYLFSMCTTNSKNKASYDINYYVDTIYGHVIVTTVVDSKVTGDISSSTLEIDNFDKVDND